MKPIDYAKALGIAAALLIVDVLIAIGVVYLYSILVDPGHPRTYYETSGIVVARWSTAPPGRHFCLPRLGYLQSAALIATRICSRSL